MLNRRVVKGDRMNEWFHLFGEISSSLLIGENDVQMEVRNGLIRREQTERFEQNVRLIDQIPIVIDEQSEMKVMFRRMAQRRDLFREMFGEERRGFAAIGRREQFQIGLQWKQKWRFEISIELPLIDHFIDRAEFEIFLVVKGTSTAMKNFNSIFRSRRTVVLVDAMIRPIVPIAGEFIDAV